MNDFATYLREKREEAGLNQSELASLVGLTGSYLSVLESRKKPPPSDAVLKRLAKALQVPEKEILEVAHLDRSPDDIRERIRALDRHLRVERKLTKRLLSDLLPSSLWHFGRIQGFHEAALEKLRLDPKRRRLLRDVLSRLGPLTTRDDFEERSRALIDSLPDEERTVLAEVVPELVREPVAAAGQGDAPSPCRLVPVFEEPPDAHGSPGRVLGAQPVAADEFRRGSYFWRARDPDMAPRVEEGDLLLVEPDRGPAPGDLVLVRVEGQVTVRQAAPSREVLLLVKPGGREAPREVAPETILGVVAELRRGM